MASFQVCYPSLGKSDTFWPAQDKITLLSLVTLWISRMVKLASLVWFSWLTIKFLPSLHDFGEEILCKSITVASMTIWYPSRLTSWIICMYKNVHLSTSLFKIQKMTLIFFTTAVHLLCNSKRECELIPCRPKHILYKGTPPHSCSQLF